MSKNTKNLTVKFIVDSAKAETKLRQAAKGIKGVEEASKKAAKGTKGMTKSTSGLNKVMGPFSTMLGGASYRMAAFVRVIQAVPGPVKAAVLAIASLGFVLKKTFDAANKAEGAIATMIALTGSQTKAYKLLEQAIKSSRTTPFTPLQEIGAAGKLVQFGMFDPFVKGLDSIDKAGKKVKISQMDVFEALGSFTDMQGNRIGLDRAIQGIMTGRKKMTRAFFRVIQDAWEATKEVTTIGSKSWGKILVENIAKNFGKVNDLALMQALTMKGMFSTIKGYGEEMWLAFSGVTQGGGLTLWTELKQIVLELRNGIGGFAKFISPMLTSLGETLGVIFSTIWQGLKTVWWWYGPRIKLAGALFVGGLQVAAELISGILRLFIKVVSNVLKMANTFLTWLGILDAGKGVLDSIADFTAKMVLGLEILFFFLGGAIDAMFDDVTEGLVFLKDYIKALIDDVFNYLGIKWKPFRTWLDIKGVFTGKNENARRDMERELTGVTDNDTSLGGEGTGTKALFENLAQKDKIKRVREVQKNKINNINNSQTIIQVVPLGTSAPDYSNSTGGFPSYADELEAYQNR